MAGNHPGLMGATADALAHFSLVASKEEILLSDLQGLRKSGDERGGLPVYVLFDTMVHR